jgi:hypothetical protein
MVAAPHPNPDAEKARQQLLQSMGCVLAKVCRLNTDQKWEG